jgi:hypothetical protein
MTSNGMSALSTFTKIGTWFKYSKTREFPVLNDSILRLYAVEPQVTYDAVSITQVTYCRMRNNGDG